MVKIANLKKILTGTCVKHLGKCTCPPPPHPDANFLKYHGSDRVKADTWNTSTLLSYKPEYNKLRQL